MRAEKRFTGYDVHGCSDPARDVGGDYYDVLQHNGRIKIGIGDVTGHGLESGVVMMPAMLVKVVRNPMPVADNFLERISEG